MAHLALLVAASLVATTRAQVFGGACGSKNTVAYADVAALASQYPPTWQVATIVPGDAVAQSLYQAINGTALAYPVNKFDANGDPVFGRYPNADPECWWSYSNCVTSKIRGIPPDGYTCLEPHTWGLSLDDGPTCVHGPLYSLLQQNNQQATLFYIGSNVALYPAEARLGFSQGHDICVHTWSHHPMTSLTDEQVFAELYYTKKIIKDVLGISPRCFRPPYGDVDDRVRTIANALELWTIIWDNDTNDWEASEIGYAIPNKDYAAILAGNYNTHGTLVLTHEVDQPAVNLFLQHWAAIRKTFQNVVSALSCLNVTAPYAEADAPIYQNFAQAAATPQLQTLTPPATAGSSGPVVFSGQAAFQASLKGQNLVVSAVAPAASASAVSASAANNGIFASSAASAPTASAAAANALVDAETSKSKIGLGAIIGVAVGGAAVLVALVVLVLCAWRRSWLCFGSSSRKQPPRRRQPIYLRSPELGDGGFAADRSIQNLLESPSPYMRSTSSLLASRSQLDLSASAPPSPDASEESVGLAISGGNDRPSSPSPMRSMTSKSMMLLPRPINPDAPVGLALVGGTETPSSPSRARTLASKSMIVAPTRRGDSLNSLDEARTIKDGWQGVKPPAGLGEAAIKLVLDSQRSLATDTLRPYADAQIRMLARETRQLSDAVKSGREQYSEFEEDHGQVCNLVISALASRRNQRALLVYHHQRLDKLKDLFWAAGAQPGRLLAQSSEERKNMSPSEVDFLRSYSELVNAYRAPFIEDGAACDVTGSLDTRPPKELYIQVKVVKDIGDIYTESGTISFKKDSLVLVRRPDVERLLISGHLVEV